MTESPVHLLTLQHFDEVFEVVTELTGDAQVDELFAKTGDLVLILKQKHLAVINELLLLYDSASEHNIDVSREVIFQLAQRLAGEE